MEECFGTIHISNSTSLCVGGLTTSEAARAREDGIEIDGLGYYLFLSSEIEPRQPIEILAKFPNVETAEKLVRLLGGGSA